MSQIKGKTGSKFPEKVLSLLEELHISSNDIRFQCYDTTSISGKYNGAQAKISEFLECLIPYIMCMGYKTNLCMKHSSKESRMVEFLFTTLQYLHNFLTRTTNRFDIYLENIEELQEGIVVENLPVTRWTGYLESGDHVDW